MNFQRSHATDASGETAAPPGRNLKIGVVVPCFRVTGQILPLLAAIGPEVARIYVVDDACPDFSGRLVREQAADPRISLLFHTENGGVGAAVLTGYRAALAEGCDVVVKIDGDGQMDPRLLPRFVWPILDGRADYTKGNRFFNPIDVRGMPPMRLFGNTILSFMTKLSSGYWTIFDPTNGYTAIHARLLAHLPLERIATRYFFESDMLFRLGTLRAMVIDIPMPARYAGETSQLRIAAVLPKFLSGNIRNFSKRLIYNYFLRDFSIASVNLVIGFLLMAFGVIFGGWHWLDNASHGVVTTPGTVMLAALPVILGLQLLLSFLSYDMTAVPVQPVHPLLPDIGNPP